MLLKQIKIVFDSLFYNSVSLKYTCTIHVHVNEYTDKALNLYKSSENFQNACLKNTNRVHLRKH